MSEKPSLSRREAIRLGLAGGALAALPRCAPPPDERSWPARPRLLDEDCPTLPIPDLAQPYEVTEDADYYSIAMQAGSAHYRPDMAIWGYAGTWPGPTIIGRPGRLVVVTQTNLLPEPMTIHTHGLEVWPAFDGHPAQPILADESYTYYYPNNQPGATLWYHDHLMDLTGEHLNEGLAGFYLIDDPAEAALQLPAGYGLYDIPLLIQDRLVVDGQLSYGDPNPFSSQRVFGVRGDTAFVNGAERPCLAVKRRKYRFRLLNGSDARRYELFVQVEDTTERVVLHQIGSDGGLLPRTVRRGTSAFSGERARLGLSPAERADIVIDFSDFAEGTRLCLMNEDTSTGDSLCREVMRFDVEEAVPDDSQLPWELAWELADIPRIDPAGAVTPRRSRWSYEGNTNSCSPASARSTASRHVITAATRWAARGTQLMRSCGAAS